MLIYLSGPYRGNIAKNIEAARRVAVELWEQGYTVICPHLNTAFFERDCKITDDYIRRDLEIVSRCDAVILLPGWQCSEGAREEKRAAEDLGIAVYEYPDRPPIEDVRERYRLVDYMRAVARRLAHGAREYGPDSYLKDDIARELAEELEDIAGWASLWWAKIASLREIK